MPQGLAEHSRKARQRMKVGLLDQVGEARRKVLNRSGGQPAPGPSRKVPLGVSPEQAIEKLANNRVQRRHNQTGGSQAPSGGPGYTLPKRPGRMVGQTMIDRVRKLRRQKG